MKRAFQCSLVCSVSLLLSPACFGQTIKVRVVDCSKGRPLARQRVSLHLLYDKTTHASMSKSTILHLETDLNGEAPFSLPEPPPARLIADVDLSSRLWNCDRFVLVSTQDVVQNGSVVAKACEEETRSKASVKPQPGEILFLALPPTWWQRLLYPLTKD